MSLSVFLFPALEQDALMQSEQLEFVERTKCWYGLDALSRQVSEEPNWGVAC